MERRRQSAKSTTTKHARKKCSSSGVYGAAHVKRCVQEVLNFYKKEGRHELPWRKTQTPYTVLVSELMLQQTQVERVVPKFIDFLETFPSVEVLASAPLSAVLKKWQGLGYNRRARFLHAAARAVVVQGGFPTTREKLEALPGVGPYTAGALCAFAYNQREVFLETNIRTVLIRHFAPRSKKISDETLNAIMQQCIARIDSPREWYAALMDFGSFIKRTEKNFSTQSRNYAKQSVFKGSRRELRGSILRILAQRGRQRSSELVRMHPLRTDAEVCSVIDDLIREQLISDQNGTLTLQD